VVTSDRCKFPLQAVTKKTSKIRAREGPENTHKTKTVVLYADWNLKFKIDEKNTWNFAWQ
jgi:hypothetical protein